MPPEVSKAEVLAAAREALSADAQPTMEEVAAAGAVSLRTLYRLFGSREALLRELDREPSSSARERILAVALDRVGQHGLADLSMEELATGAGVSRATLYRLFPGKPALFRELIETYSPWEAVAQVINAAPDRAPDQVMPQVGRALAEAMAGRTGLLLRMVSDMVKGNPDTSEGVKRSMAHGLPDLIAYLGEQMTAGRLRRMHPVVAFQLFAGPIVVHLITRPLADLIGLRTSQEDVVQQLVAAWLRAMAPEEQK
jgi:AcrR family transcriptional regulator